MGHPMHSIEPWLNRFTHTNKKELEYSLDNKDRISETTCTRTQALSASFQQLNDARVELLVQEREREPPVRAPEQHFERIDLENGAQL